MDKGFVIHDSEYFIALYSDEFSRLIQDTTYLKIIDKITLIYETEKWHHQIKALTSIL